MALEDNQKAWEMHGDGSYTRVECSEGEIPVDLQEDLWEKYGQ